MSQHSIRVVPRPPGGPRGRRPRAGLVIGALVPIAALVAGVTALSAAGAGSGGDQIGQAADAVASASVSASPASPAASAGSGSAAVKADAAAATPAPDPAAGTPVAPAPAPATNTATIAAQMAVAPAPGAPNPVPPAAANTNCTLVVPADPLSAKGLATPYQLVATDPAAGPCKEADKVQSAFVQGAILSPRGRLTLYNPLVVDAGTQPAVAPVPALVPAGSTVGLWFGFNGDTLTLKAADGTTSLQQGACVNGSGASTFGQFAHCNAPAFFAAANAAIRRGALRVPRLGTARDGMPCPTVRDFSVVDQDQSDNVNTHYLATADGRTAQPNAAWSNALGTTTDLANGSDNRLLTEFILPTLGCRSFTRPDQSNNAQLTASLPLQELQAAAGQRAPIAIVPLNDPMTLEGDQPSTAKTNLFRAGVDQPTVGARDSGDPKTYCQGMFTSPKGLQRVFAGQQIYSQGKSPNPAAATNLFTFLAARASDAFGILGCDALLGQTDPITLTTDAAGVVTGATFTAGGAPAAGTPGQTPSPSASPGAPSPTATPSPTPGTPTPTGSPAAGNPVPTTTPTPTPTRRRHTPPPWVRPSR